MSALLLYLSMASGLVGQTQPGPATQDNPEARLAIMKKSMARVQLRDNDAGGASYRLQPEPVLRFTNPVGQSQDGAVFLWMGEGDRPGAAVQVFLTRSGPYWLQEWTSLATGPLVAKTDGAPVWAPQRGGAVFRPIPGAPKPAETAAQRLRQMHDLTSNFTARDYHRRQTWQPLRLLSKPLARYGKPGSGVTDGALFAFVLTTDPEALLMIEARTGRDGPEWQYAFAPMSIYTIECSYNRQVVCELQSGNGPPDKDPAGTFYTRIFQPGE